MNKFIYIVIALVVACSCVREEVAIFDDSSANRLDKAIKDYSTLLTSAPKGWVMEYFANNGEPGYTFLMHFSANGAVTIAAKNAETGNIYRTETSLWEIIADQGPVLTFNTANSLFHLFSDPLNNGRGHLGDYEFIMLNNDGNSIELKGKKRSIRIYMHRLADTTDWQEYYAHLDRVKASFFTTKIPTLWLTAAVEGGVERYSITQATTGVLHFVPEGGDAISQTTTGAIIILPNGIRFMQPYGGSNGKFALTEFEIVAEGKYLRSKEDGVSTIKAPIPLDLFVDKGIGWRIDKNRLGGKFLELYNTIVAKFAVQFPTRPFNYFEFKYINRTSSSGTYALAFQAGTATGHLYGDESIADNTLSFSFDGTRDTNATLFIGRVPEVLEFTTLLQTGAFLVTSSDANEMQPLALKLTSTLNPNDYFYVDLQ